MNSKTYLLLASITLLVLLGVVYALQSTSPASESEGGVGTVGTVRTSAPTEVIDPQTGEVDQDVFESEQAVSEDTSLNGIEAELDNTIILEEDLAVK